MGEDGRRSLKIHLLRFRCSVLVVEAAIAAAAALGKKRGRGGEASATFLINEGRGKRKKN